MVNRRLSPRSRRARERGATLFVVVLVITLLTGVGLYTVHSAGLVAQAAGNGRQSIQTEHLSQVGALATMSKLVQAPALLIDAQILAKQAGAFQEDCRSTRGVSTVETVPPFCLELNSERAEDFQLAGGVSLFEDDSFGMGKGDSLLTGKFQTETTEVDKAGPVAGSSVGSTQSGPRMAYYQAKITSIAQMLPARAVLNGACSEEDMMQVTGQHITRAHVIVGPIPE
ncbi:MAG TPA: hypothetical protein VGK73_24185 [Polyangiaceae bacterium]